MWRKDSLHGNDRIHIIRPCTRRKTGGLKKTADTAKKLIEDAKSLQNAGAFAIVLELVPREIAEIVTNELDISTIGIGAGAECDIQVLVLHDLVGMTFGRLPRFVRKYADIRDVMTDAVGKWMEDVKNGDYPNDEESYGLPESVNLEDLK